MNIYFYLIKVEAFKIGYSEPAPKFTFISFSSVVSSNIEKRKKNLLKDIKRD